jgi:predicted membrane GTPase involved in stress response
MFCKPGDAVYEGQVVGIYNKSGDLKINVCKAKALTNMRASQSEKKVRGQSGLNVVTFSWDRCMGSWDPNKHRTHSCMRPKYGS